jgi:hypothetical protein
MLPGNNTNDANGGMGTAEPRMENLEVNIRGVTGNASVIQRERLHASAECWVCVIFFACVCVWVRQIRRLRLRLFAIFSGFCYF